MKILSKYKDYYDYLSGVWGEDPKLILDRRKGYPKPIGEKYQFQLDQSYKITLIICGRLIEGYRYQNKIYYGEELRQFANTENSRWNNIKYPHITIHDGLRNWYSKDNTYTLEPVEGYDEINQKYNCPILKKKGSDYIEYPKLEELDLASFIKAETIYKWLSEYLARELDNNLEKISDLTDVQKLENKGFDKVISFRKR